MSYQKRVPEPFKTEKGTLLKVIDFQGKDYMEVSQRVRWFREVFPDGMLSTDVIENNGEASTVKATVLRYVKESNSFSVLATGHKRILNKDFPKGPLEKAETQALGRALAAAGFGIQFEPEFDDAEDGIIADAPQERNGNEVQSGKNASGKSAVRSKGGATKQPQVGAGDLQGTEASPPGSIQATPINTSTSAPVGGQAEHKSLLATAKNRSDVNNLLSSVSRSITAKKLLTVTQIKQYMTKEYGTDDKAKLPDEAAHALLNYLDYVNTTGLANGAAAH